MSGLIVKHITRKVSVLDYTFQCSAKNLVSGHMTEDPGHLVHSDSEDIGELRDLSLSAWVEISDMDTQAIQDVSALARRGGEHGSTPTLTCVRNCYYCVVHYNNDKSEFQIVSTSHE